MPSIDDQISKMVGRREGSEEYCIRIGLWDCTSCDRKQIWGPLKSCPSCGNSKDTSEESLEYLPEGALYYTEAQVAEMATGQADWICQYCGGLVSSKQANCTNCSAAESGKTVSVIEYASDAEIPSSNPKDNHRDEKIETNNAQLLMDSDEENGRGFPKILLAFFGTIGLLFLGIFVFWLFSSSEIKATVQNFSWKREIVVENYQTVIESDWSIPAGGRKVSSSREIKSYKQVIDHYDNKTESVRVPSGSIPYRYKCGTKKVGDGTFKDKYCDGSKTVYTNKSETKKVPVYRDDPIYDTKYKYEIDKWVYYQTLQESGGDQNPKWPNFVALSNLRENGRTELYTVTFTSGNKKFEVKMPYSDWINSSVGQSYVLKYNNLGVLLEYRAAN